jgi:hypothetical protein
MFQNPSDLAAMAEALSQSTGCARGGEQRRLPVTRV